MVVGIGRRQRERLWPGIGPSESAERLLGNGRQCGDYSRSADVTRADVHRDHQPCTKAYAKVKRHGKVFDTVVDITIPQNGS